MMLTQWDKNLLHLCHDNGKAKCNRTRMQLARVLSLLIKTYS